MHWYTRLGASHPLIGGMNAPLLNANATGTVSPLSKYSMAVAPGNQRTEPETLPCIEHVLTVVFFRCLRELTHVLEIKLIYNRYSSERSILKFKVHAHYNLEIKSLICNISTGKR